MKYRSHFRDMPVNWEKTAYPGLGPVRLLRSIYGICPDCNHPNDQHWGEDDYVEHRCRGCPEHIRRGDGDDDFLYCLCGNDPTMAGFQPCLDDGTEVEPLAGGPWQGKLYICYSCGRIVDQDTLEVTGFRDIGGD